MCICLRPIIYVIARRNRSHQHRTSSNKGNSSSDADGGARVSSHRTAKENSLGRVCFGCFFILKNRIHHCREPPYSNQFTHKIDWRKAL